MRRLATLAGAAFLFGLGVLLFGGGKIGRSWAARVAVAGHSMEPTLLDGDWLLVDPLAYTRRAPRAGELVVTRDPRDESRVIVKRVKAADGDGSLVLAGDHPAHADDFRRVGAASPASVLGRPWLRYWPPGRVGPV